jgi:hypothetical protein
MRKAQIVEGVVVNVIEVDPLNIPPWCADWPDALGAGPGHTYDGTTFSPAPPPAPLVPVQISFAQLLTGLVSEGWITEAEGDGWLAGTLPFAVTALIATLPAGQRFAAKAKALRPSVVLRADPLVAALGAAQGKTTAELDDFFINCESI